MSVINSNLDDFFSSIHSVQTGSDNSKHNIAFQSTHLSRCNQTGPIKGVQVKPNTKWVTQVYFLLPISKIDGRYLIVIHLGWPDALKNLGHFWIMSSCPESQTLSCLSWKWTVKIKIIDAVGLSHTVILKNAALNVLWFLERRQIVMNNEKHNRDMRNKLLLSSEENVERLSVQMREAFH